VKGKSIPNWITAGRILLAAALLFFPAFSFPFFLLYIAAGLTDMVDGAVARKTGTVSKFGDRLDSAADLALVAACLIKLLPALDVPAWLQVWIAGVALIRAVNLVSSWVMRARPVFLHTVMNKLTGGLLFILPLTAPVVDLKISASLVCAVATFAAIQEGHFIRTGREE